MDESSGPAILAATAVAALSYLDRYSNIIVTLGHCQDGCGITRCELWRVDDEDEEGGRIVAEGGGASVFEAIISAHVQLQKALDDANERSAEVDALEELFNLSSES